MQVGEFTGAATYQYPVKLPPGRNGMTPSLGISYNGQDEALDNLIGYHWSLNQYSIQRINKEGVEKLYASNDFTAETPIGSGELVELGGGFYSEKIESSFARYEFKSDNSWVVTDKKELVLFSAPLMDLGNLTPLTRAGLTVGRWKKYAT